MNMTDKQTLTDHIRSQYSDSCIILNAHVLDEVAGDICDERDHRVIVVDTHTVGAVQDNATQTMSYRQAKLFVL